MRYWILIALLFSTCCFGHPVPWEEEAADSDLGFFSECALKHMKPQSEHHRGRLGVHVETNWKHSKTLWDIIKSEKDFLYYRCAISHLKLEEIFNGESKEENITVLIPTNEAFRRLPRNVIRRLLRPEFKEDLIAVLKYHILDEEYTTADMKDGETAESLMGEKVVFSARSMLEDKEEIVLVNHALLVMEDKEASNGIAHGIDTVLLPDHFMINRSHEHFKNKTMGEVMEKVPVFQRLWKAIKSVKLDKVLSDKGSKVTFFAPPDYVWKRGPFEKLLESDNSDELFDVLKYHIVEDIVYSIELADGDKIKTAQGDKLYVMRSQFMDNGEEDLFVDYALVRRRDYVFLNGVMHIVDRPLVPK